MGDIDEAAEDRVLQGETDEQPFMALEQADLREIRPSGTDQRTRCGTRPR